jgi:hypothetical protein
MLVSPLKQSRLFALWDNVYVVTAEPLPTKSAMEYVFANQRQRGGRLHCRHPIMPQSGHEGDRLPFPLRDVADQSLATRATAAEADHVGRDRGLVDKDQSRRIKIALLSNPAPTPSRHVGSVLLGCPQAFFCT